MIKADLYDRRPTLPQHSYTHTHTQTGMLTNANARQTNKHTQSRTQVKYITT